MKTNELAQPANTSCLLPEKHCLSVSILNPMSERSKVLNN